MNRREFSNALLETVISYSLIDSLFVSSAFAKKIEPIAKHWAVNLSEFCADLKKESISPLEWQNHIQQLYNKIELRELLQFIDFENLTKGFNYPDLGVNTKPVKFPKLNGLPEQTVFVKKIFGMKKDRAIIPHGHSNMASAHLIIGGEMHLRNYEKISQEGDKHLIIKPTVDKTISLGESSTISDEKDNIHWFVANSNTAFTFDVIMLDLQGKPYDIHNIDIEKKQNLANGTMRVPILEVDAALKKYGKQTHH
ncbi:MAG: hypothetical protein R2822_24690 [Spirosomataceae bacterium]